jgi:hypothetical protein
MKIMRLLGLVLLDEFSLKVLRTALEIVEAAQSGG